MFIHSMALQHALIWQKTLATQADVTWDSSDEEDEEEWDDARESRSGTSYAGS